jgi:hypothetical protein
MCLNKVVGTPSTVRETASVSSKEILQVLMKYVWPKGHPRLKARVLFALALLIGAKLLTISVPFLFKDLIDRLSDKDRHSTSGEGSSDSWEMALLAAPLALVIGCECIAHRSQRLSP